jgi:hypothetical protein
MSNFNENKVTFTHFIPITLLLIRFMPNYLPFGCVFLSFLAHFSPFRSPGSGSAFGIRIRIQAAIEWGFIADPDPKY